MMLVRFSKSVYTQHTTLAPTSKEWAFQSSAELLKLTQFKCVVYCVRCAEGFA